MGCKRGAGGCGSWGVYYWPLFDAVLRIECHRGGGKSGIGRFYLIPQDNVVEPHCEDVARM